MTKDLPYVLRTADFLNFAINRKIKKEIKVYFFSEKKEGQNYKLVDGLSMLLVINIIGKDRITGETKVFRRIPQTTTADENGVLRIYKESKTIAETIEMLISNGCQFEFVYISNRKSPEDQFPKEIESFKRIHKQNLENHLIQKGKTKPEKTDTIEYTMERQMPFNEKTEEVRSSNVLNLTQRNTQQVKAVANSPASFIDPDDLDF